MSTMPAESKSAPASIVEPTLGQAVLDSRGVDDLQHDAFIEITTGIPSFDDADGRAAFMDFLRAVAETASQAHVGAFEGTLYDYRRALRAFHETCDTLSKGQSHCELREGLSSLIRVIVRLADELDEPKLGQRALEWQICAANPGNERASAHADLADFLVEHGGDPAKAKVHWEMAAQQAVTTPLDPRRSIGFWERAFSLSGDDPAVAEALVLGYAKLGDWTMAAGPFDVLLRSVAHTADSERVLALVLALEASAIEQREGQVFATLVDEVLWSVSRDIAPYARPLMLSKARVLAADPDRFDAALDAYYALLEAHATDEDLSELTAFIRTCPDTLKRHAQFARLFEWRMGRAEDQRILLGQWAKMEEQEFRDFRAAANQLERILAQDSTNTEALREIRRLHEANCDWDAVELTLRRLSERLTGADRDEVDCERAEILATRLNCPEAALELVSSVLDRGVAPARARAVLAVLLTSDDPELRLSAAERSFSLAPSDPPQQVALLRSLIEGTAVLAKDGTGRGSLRANALRRQWMEQAVALSNGTDADFTLACSAVVEFPDSDVLWAALGPWTSDANRARDIVELYSRAIERTTDRELLELLGKKMVAFAEKANVDAVSVVEGLTKLVRSAPGVRWALDRVKLHLGAQGKWSDLLELYDGAMAEARSNGDVTSETYLLTEASVTAKDLANDADRAIRYFERILELNPGDARTYAALERLYERHGHTDRLVAHLTRRMPALAATELRQLKDRIANLWIEAGRFDLALDGVREEVEANGEWPSATSLLERICESPAARHAIGDRMSTAELAAQILATLHRNGGRNSELARLLRNTADFVAEPRRKILLLTELAETFETLLGDESGALQVVGELLLLDPGQEWHRSWLARLATRSGAAELRVRLLLRAADLLPPGSIRARILSEAAQVSRDVLDDPAQAIDLFGQVVECGSESPELALLALEALDPLLSAEGHVEERCNVLECLAESTDDIAVRQYALRAAAQLSASALSDVERAATNWRALLDEIPSDAEALEGFIVALEAQERWQDLAQTLSYRVNLGENLPHTVPDRKRLARIYATRLHNLNAAIAEWQSLVHDDPHDYDSRDRITELLTENERWPELVQHLTAQVLYADDAPSLYRLLSAVHREHTGDVRAATEALLHAGDVSASALLITDGPGAKLDDASLRLDVAAALAAHGEANLATTVLGIQVELYADRKPKERSIVHLSLARAWLCASEPRRALAELDLAIGIDPTNGEILALHGKVAFELGVLASAEQSYRALLLLAMHAAGDDLELPALSVLYFRLAQIAERRADRERADELIASAFDAALNQETQTRELEHALIEARADDLLLKTLDSQLSRASVIEDSAAVLMDFATRRLKLGEPSPSLLTRLRERADQISTAISDNFDAHRAIRAHGALVTTYRLLGEPGCALSLLLSWSRLGHGSSIARTLEVEAAKLMLEFPERRGEGIETLLLAWSEDKSREDVAAVLSSALAGEGRFEEQSGLLVERIARAERTAQIDSANVLRLELGALHERMGRPDDAVVVYDSVAAASVEHRLAALEAQSRVLAAQGKDVEQHCRVLEALLEMTNGRKAAEIALTLAHLRRDAASGDGADIGAAIERALAHGFAQDPTYEPVREALVGHYRASNQVEKARSILELALARSPRDLRLVIELVELAEAMSAPERALEVLDSALVYLPEDPELNRRRWQLLVRADRHEDALVVLEREYARGTVSALEVAAAIEKSGLSRSSRMLRFREVELLVAGCAEDSARARLTDWIATHPDDAEAHRELARLAVKANAWDEVVNTLARLVRIDTPEGSVAAALDLAIACDKIGAKARAVEPLEWAFRIAPTHAELEQRLLKSYAAVGMHEPMARVFAARSRRVTTEKDRISALESAAAHYLLADAPLQANDCLDQALDLAPEKLSLVLAKVKVLRAQGLHEQALALAVEHTTGTRHARDKERYRLFEALAEIHLDEDELVEASEALVQAHRLDRSQPRIALLLGLVAADLDDIATASSALRAAVISSRTDETTPALSCTERAAAYAELARLQLLRGSQSTARQFLEKAVEEDASHHAVLQISPALQRT